MGDRTQQQYQTLTNGEKDFDRTDLNRLNDEKSQVKQQLLAHNFYKTDLRARELLDYSMLELDTDKLTNRGQGFNLSQLLQARSNFDQLFAGKYEKTLDPKVKEHVESKADELYLQETGQKQVDRASQLWKSLRNVEVLKYDRSLWNTVQQSPTQQQGNVMQTVVEQPRDARDNVLTSPVGTGPKLPSHTGHGVPEQVETGTKPFGEGVRPNVSTDTGHLKNEKAAVTDVFESQTSLRYKLKPNDADWRGSGITFQEALNKAFEKTGVPKEDFQVSKWGKDVYGKSIPVEYEGPNGEQVSVDYPHYGEDSKGNWVSGPDAPHIGWKIGKKGSKQVGHIILDSVPAGRPTK
jgi:hypothetical protein